MIYDISPLIDEKLTVWPGDEKLYRKITCDMHQHDHLTLSSLHSTVHLGAHADAPNHFCIKGLSIGECELDSYLGPCQVITVSVKRNQTILPSDITVPISAKRILFHTDTFPDPTCWNNDFAAFSPELIDHLAKHKVKLVGIDTPSVDLFHSKELWVHKKIADNKMAILEGIVLNQVPDGIYELIALPLKLMHFEASPVRAILRTF